MGNKVMIVDDEYHIRFGVGELLESAGFQVLAASSGRECLEELRKGFQGLMVYLA